MDSSDFTNPTFPLLDACIADEVICPVVKTHVVDFKYNGYMQVSHFAIECHLRNLCGTFGKDVVMGVIEKEMKNYERDEKEGFFRSSE